MRLFAALRPPAAIRDRCDALMDGIDGARWQDDEQLHVTLCFVGTVEPRAAEAWSDRLATIAAAQFALRLSGVGHFERKGRPSAVWAGLAPCPALDALQRKIVQAARATGLPIERRRFRPHVTLARLNSGSGPVAPWLACHGAFASAPWTVDHFAMYESVLDPGGSIYAACARYPFAATALSPCSTPRR